MRFFIARFGHVGKQHGKKTLYGLYELVFLTDLERIQASYQFRISCSYPRSRNIFLLHSRKKG